MVQLSNFTTVAVLVPFYLIKITVIIRTFATHFLSCSLVSSIMASFIQLYLYATAQCSCKSDLEFDDIRGDGLEDEI